MLTRTALSAIAEGAWEGIVAVPETLSDGATVELVEDNGDSVWYEDGRSSKAGLPAGLQKDLGRTFTIALAPAPVITPVISGTLGQNGWYVSNVTVSWEVSSSVPASSCAPSTLSSDTAGTVVSCTSTSAGGSTTASVTIKLDKTKPTVSFAGGAGSYTVTQTVAITCSASDPTPGSGLASSNCPSVNAPAWSLGPGTHTLSASASDNAGNTGTASASYTVTVIPASLCTLTSQFVQGSAKYQQLNALSRLVVNALVSAGCSLLTEIGPQLKPAQAASFIAAYQQAVQGLAGSGWLTQAQAGVLKTFAGSL